MRDMKGYCKSLLLPGFAFFEEQKGTALPKHLAEVSRLCSENEVNGISLAPFQYQICGWGSLCRPSCSCTAHAEEHAVTPIIRALQLAHIWR